jgi:hypothetical protein
MTKRDEFSLREENFRKQEYQMKKDYFLGQLKNFA